MPRKLAKTTLLCPGCGKPVIRGKAAVETRMGFVYHPKCFAEHRKTGAIPKSDWVTRTSRNYFEGRIPLWQQQIKGRKLYG